MGDHPPVFLVVIDGNRYFVSVACFAGLNTVVYIPADEPEALEHLLDKDALA